MSAEGEFAGHIGALIRRIEELERRQANTIRPGKVTEVDYAKGLVKVKVGDLPSQWVPWMETAGAIKTWTPPSVGQQVHLVSPSGEPGQGWVLPGGYSSDNKQPHDKGAEHKMQIGGASILVTGDKITITAADVEVIGKLQVTGDMLRHNDKNVGDDHKHDEVVKGGDLTGNPI